MNYEIISKMTFSELRALEYDINRIKNERSWGRPSLSKEFQEIDRKFQLERHSEYDKEQDEEWAALLRSREFEKTYRKRVAEFDITAVSRLPNMLGNLILEFIGIEKKNYEQNHRRIKKYDTGNNPNRPIRIENEEKFSFEIMKLARKKANDIHQWRCVANFRKMKMKKIKELFANTISLQNISNFWKFKMNSKDNFIQSLIGYWNSHTDEKFLTLLIASTR